MATKKIEISKGKITIAGNSGTAGVEVGVGVRLGTEVAEIGVEGIIKVWVGLQSLELYVK